MNKTYIRLLTALLASLGFCSSCKDPDERNDIRPLYGTQATQYDASIATHADELT